MITEQDITATQLSYTKKDFYQIYTELLDTARKISDRWDPTSTNETDPGIVLLKVLTAVADKINYNIDKNILEAFMPSATQEESMRRLCEMMGYNVKYYQSAKTEVVATYKGNAYDTESNESIVIRIPMFTVIKDQNDEITYTLLEGINLTSDAKSNIENPAIAIEGELEDCTTGDSTVITLSNIDDNDRFYLPEAQIAENGIFIVNVPTIETDITNLKWIGDDDDSDTWIKVDNLNIQPTEKRCWKFGFDSKQGLPYIQFPDDIDSLIGNGLYIKYIRTSGVNGNISAKTLAKFDSLTLTDDAGESITAIDPTDIYVTNYSAVKNGANIETINEAYTNYKKTVGTFDTLVTCRDYMNKIYQLMDDHNLPLVSNIIVSDIRDDINYSYKISTFSDYGFTQKDIVTQSLDDEGEYVDDITHFDLVFYPFNRVTGLNTETEFKESFKYTNTKMTDILDQINDYKTISHNIINPGTNDLICIKNYLNLNAKITTTKKVNSLEEAEIKSKIYTALYKNFNMRKVDFGEEIPYDSLLECIENADSRIKNVVLDDPELETKFLLEDNTELAENDTSTGTAYKRMSNKLLIRNILAGRIPMFDYDTNFKYSFTERAINTDNIKPLYPLNDNQIEKLIPKFSLADGTKDYVLKENEVVRFSAPNFKTETTYPAYVNYYLQLTATASDGVAASMRTIQDYALALGQSILDNKSTLYAGIANAITIAKLPVASYNSVSEVQAALVDNAFIYYYDTDSKQWMLTTDGSEWSADKVYHILKITSDNFIYWNNAFIELYPENYTGPQSLFTRKLGYDSTNVPGYLVDANKYKYSELTSWSGAVNSSLTYYYMPNALQVTASDNWGLGIDPSSVGINKNCEYQLKDGEYLYINYTPSSTTDEDGNSVEQTPITLSYGPGTIIRPSMYLYSSSYYHDTAKHSYSKTGTDIDQSIAPVDGMFTLGSDEQIEIRKQVQVILDENPVFIYWSVGNNDENAVDAGDGKIRIDWQPDNTYVLKENDYFYYTDKYKSDFTVFGSGTEIINNTGLTLAKDKDSNISYDDIAENGLNAIPWIKLNTLSETKNIILNEYQYITLTEGDTYCVDGDSTKYKMNGTAGTLPTFNIKNGDKDITWDKQFLLSLNCGPNKTQTMHENDTLYIKYYSGDKVEITGTYTYGESTLPVSFKTNYSLSVTAEETYFRGTAEYDEDGDFTDWTKDGKIKFFYYDTEASTADDEYTDNYTITTLATNGSASTNNKQLLISLNAPATFGLIMVYATSDKIKVVPSSASGSWDTDTGIRLYNSADKYHTSAITLNKGINILELTTNVSQLNFWNSSKVDQDNATITYSNEVDAIKEIPVDALGYSGDSAALLEEIATIDTNSVFYYNCPISNSTAMNVNTTNGEKPTDAKLYYDYNNINNKFVISEINYGNLSKGITLTRQSKLS